MSGGHLPRLKSRARKVGSYGVHSTCATGRPCPWKNYPDTTLFQYRKRHCCTNCFSLYREPRSLLSSIASQGIVGRVNAYISYNAAIDAATAEEHKVSSADACAVGVDDGGDDGPTLRLPPIEQVSGAGNRPRSATRPITPGRVSRIEGWHLG